MGGPQVAFDRGHVVGKLRQMGRGVGVPATSAAFLIHPRNHAQRALGAKMELLQQLCGFHRDRYSGGVIDGAGAQVPRVLPETTTTCSGCWLPRKSPTTLYPVVSGRLCGVSVRCMRTLPCAARCEIRSASSTATAPAGMPAGELQPVCGKR